MVELLKQLQEKEDAYLHLWKQMREYFEFADNINFDYEKYEKILYNMVGKEDTLFHLIKFKCNFLIDLFDFMQRKKDIIMRTYYVEFYKIGFIVSAIKSMTGGEKIL